MPEHEQPGYLESAQRLVEQRGRRWDLGALRRAAERAQLRNTGWPIGVVLTKQGLAPRPVDDGIEVRIGREGAGEQIDWEDFWRFSVGGSFYVVRIFEEEFAQPGYATSTGHPDRPMWFDLRIWRIAEVVLHSATLYRELGISPAEPYALSVTHGGLDRREFWTSDPARWVLRGRFSDVPHVTWTGEVTQDYVHAAIKEITATIARELFVVFDFEEIPVEAINEIVDRFLNSRR